MGKTTRAARAVAMIGVASIMLGAGFSGTQAATPEFPRALTGELIAIEREKCQQAIAYGQSFYRFTDVTGDGQVDLVLDYKDANCYIKPDLFCPNGSNAPCFTKVYQRQGGSWKRIYEGTPRSLSTAKTAKGSQLVIDGRPLGN